MDNGPTIFNALK